jgi:hypothetical protein
LRKKAPITYSDKGQRSFQKNAFFKKKCKKTPEMKNIVQKKEISSPEKGGVRLFFKNLRGVVG